MRIPALVARVGAAIALVVCSASSAGAQLNENCTVSVLNRSVRINPDGSWVLPNIPANFGPVRARVTCVVDGQTISGESEPFVVPANGVVNLPHIVFGGTTPIPTSLTVNAPTHTLTSVGATLPLTVTGLYSDGSAKDVSAGSAGTQYTVTNPAIATVSSGGVVQAVTSGTVLVQATHEGASGIFSVRVSIGGADSDGDGIPDEIEIALGLNPNNPIDALEDADRDGLTNKDEYLLGTDLRKADTDGDGLSDGVEASGSNGFRTDPLKADTDGDGIRDGLEVQTGSDPLNPSSFNLSRALTGIAVTPAQFTITFNTIEGAASRQLIVTGTLLDGTSITLTSRQRGTNYASSDLSICSFGPTDGQVFAGSTGACTITIGVAGFSATATGTITTFSPKPLSFVNLPAAASNVDVSGDVAYVSDGSAGLQIIDVSNRLTPRVVASLALPGTANDVRVLGGRAYVAAGAAGLLVVDVANPTAPRLLGSVDTPGTANDVVVRGTLAYVADGASGLLVVDVANPAAPKIVGGVATAAPANGVDVTGTLAAVAIGAAGLQIVNVANPTSPGILGSVDTPGDAQDVVVDGSMAYVADYTGSLRVVDFTTPGAPILRGTTSTTLGGVLTDVAFASPFVFGADIFFVNGVPIVDVSNPANPAPRAILDFRSFRDDDGTGIAIDSSYVYLTVSQARLYIGQYRSIQDSSGIPPTVAIASPPNGSVFVEGESIPVTVTATDDVAVTSVSLLVNGAPIATDTTAPYQFTVAAPVGVPTLVLGASATDPGNNLGLAPAIQVAVIPDPLTTVTGRVLLESSSPVAGAQVACLGRSAVTSSGGTFTVFAVATIQPTVVCTAVFTPVGGTLLHGSSPAVIPVRGGLTDAGTIVLLPVPVISAVSPKAFDALRPPASLQITGANLTASTFSFSLVAGVSGIAAGPPSIDAAGTSAMLPITVSQTAQGQFVVIASNDRGTSDSTPSAGNTVRLINAQDDGDTDGDKFPDGLELLFGSDPASASSTPDFSTQGQVRSAAVSLVNTAVPPSDQSVVSAAVSVANLLPPSGTQKSAVSPAVSVRNTLLAAGTQQSALSAAVSVANTVLASGAEQSALSPAVSVLNTLLAPAATQVLSPAVSVRNQAANQPAPAQTQVAPAPTDARPASGLRLLASGAEQREIIGALVEGQTISIAPTGDLVAVRQVQLFVNDVLAATDSSAPFEFMFTVPSGVSALDFRVAATDAADIRVASTEVSVPVEIDPTTTVAGRVVDSAGQPVKGATVALESEGLQAAFFDYAARLGALPELDGRTATRVSRVTAVNQWNPDGIFGVDPFGARRTPDYAARFTGFIRIPSAGAYTFFVGADEGARLKVGGVTVVDNATGSGSYREAAGAMTLAAGLVPIDLTYYSSVGQGELRLFIAGADGERQVISPEMLIPAAAPFMVTTDDAGQFVFSGVPTVLQGTRVTATVTVNGQVFNVSSPRVDRVSKSAVSVGDIVVPIPQAPRDRQGPSRKQK